MLMNYSDECSACIACMLWILMNQRNFLDWLPNFATVVAFLETGIRWNMSRTKLKPKIILLTYFSMFEATKVKTLHDSSHKALTKKNSPKVSTSQPTSPAQPLPGRNSAFSFLRRYREAWRSALRSEKLRLGWRDASVKSGHQGDYFQGLSRRSRNGFSSFHTRAHLQQLFSNKTVPLPSRASTFNCQNVSNKRSSP